MNRLLLVFKMLRDAVQRIRNGDPPFTHREMVAGFSQAEKNLFPELKRFPDPISAEEAWQQAAEDVKGLWSTFGLLVVGMLVAWRVVRGLLLAWLSHQIVLGWFSKLCLDILVGGVIGVVAIVWAMRLRQGSVSRSLRRQLNALAEPTCLSCGYDLTGNESGRCPECGYSTARA